MESPRVLVLLTFTESCHPAEVVGTVSTGSGLAESKCSCCLLLALAVPSIRPSLNINAQLFSIDTSVVKMYLNVYHRTALFTFSLNESVLQLLHNIIFIVIFLSRPSEHVALHTNFN